jgi:glucokinase
VPLYLALDFGGTKLACGLVDSAKGMIFTHVRRASPPSATESLHEMMNMAREALGGRAALSISGVGISFGGPVDAKRARVRLSHHVPGWEDFPLVDEVVRSLGFPAAMDNDANLQCLGEWRYGAGRGTQNMLYVNVGTGIGGGLILGGQLHRGAHGLAGEVGHTVVDPNGPICTCGKRGCVESLAAGPAIARSARDWLATRPNDGSWLIADVGGDPSKITSEAVFKLAGEGDSLCRLVVARAARYLGIGIANAAAIVDPELVVVGGGVAKAGPLLFTPLVGAAREASAPLDPEMLNIVPGQLLDDANILGAVALAERDFGG